MPTYQFHCDPDNSGCNNLIEVKCAYDDKGKNTPKSCPKCRKRKSLYEIFGGGQHTFIPVTVGHLADTNASKMSQDEKHHLTTKHNDYRQKPGEHNWISTDAGMVHVGEKG